MPHIAPVGRPIPAPTQKTPHCSNCGDSGPPLSRYVSVKTVAEALECSDDLVRDLLANGTFPYLDIARRTGNGKHRAKIRIPVARVEAYLEAQLRTAPKVVTA